MLRSKEEWVAKALEAGNLLVQILVFLLGLWLTSLLPGADVLGWVIGTAVSFIAAVFIPALLFSRPSLGVSWNIDGNDFVGGYAFVDLTKPDPRFNGPEIAFKVDLITEYRSLAGFLILRWLVKKKWLVCVECGPSGVVGIKTQRPGVAKVIELDGAAAIALPLVKVRHGWKQTRLIGSFVPEGIVSGRDSVQFALSLRDPSNGFHRIQAAMTSGIDGLDVRS